MFASKTKKTVEINDDGSTVVVTVRKLGWKKLREAAEAQTTAAISTATKAGPAIMQMWAAEADKDKKGEEKEKSPDARYASYDRDTILRAGIESWTAAAKLPDAIDDLDDEAADALHRAIVDLSVPAPEVAARAKGEGASPSTGS